MGKRSILIRVVLMLALAAGVLVAGDGDQAWFDLEGCAMCKNFAAEPGLMEHVEWQNHMISDGVMTISIIDEEYQGAMQRAQKNMGTVAQKYVGILSKPARLSPTSDPTRWHATRWFGRSQPSGGVMSSTAEAATPTRPPRVCCNR